MAPSPPFGSGGIHQSVADLVEEPTPRRLAGEEAYRRGQVILEQGGARLLRSGPLRVVAQVSDGGEDHRVELRSTEDGLAWSCDCGQGAAGVFCKHCVTAAAITWRSAPKRRD